MQPETTIELFYGDHTHTNPEAARLNASMVVDGLKALPDCPLCRFLRTDLTQR